MEQQLAALEQEVKELRQDIKQIPELLKEAPSPGAGAIVACIVIGLTGCAIGASAHWRMGAISQTQEVNVEHPMTLQDGAVQAGLDAVRRQQETQE